MKIRINNKAFLPFLAVVTFCLMGTSARASIVLHMEDFNDNVADGWTLNAPPGTSSTTLETDPVNSTLALHVDTGPVYQIAETPSFDLTTATTASITFDYADEDGGATRFISVDFWNGSSWTQLVEYRHSSTNNGTGFVLNVNSGFAVDNKFRFEGKNGGGGGNKATFIDNVVIEADVTNIPEPSSFALFGLGSLALMVRRRN